MVDTFEIFMECVCHAGTIVATCDLCGRTYYNYMDAGCFEEGELENLEKKSEEEPDKYIGVDHTVGMGRIDGKQVIWDCKCEKAKRYEKWIWDHRRIIAEYLKRRTAEEFEEAKKEVKLTEGF